MNRLSWFQLNLWDEVEAVLKIGRRRQSPGLFDDHFSLKGIQPLYDTIHSLCWSSKPDGRYLRISLQSVSAKNAGDDGNRNVDELIGCCAIAEFNSWSDLALNWPLYFFYATTRALY